MSVRVRYRKLSDGSSKPYLDIYHKGQRMKETLDIIIRHGDQLRRDKMKMIETIRSKRELEIIRDEIDFEKNRKSKIDFLEYYATFLANYKGKDVRLVRYSLVRFKRMVNVDIFPLSQLTHEICADFARYLQDPKNGLRGETVHNYWRKFKRVIHQLIYDEIITKNPLLGIYMRPVQNQLKKNVLTENELHLIAQTACERPEIKNAFLFSCYSGLGYAELKKLRWSNIQNGKLIIFREKTGEQIINDLHPVCLKLIGDPCDPENCVFNLPSNTSVAKWLKRWIKASGIEKHISFYCGRHTFATQLLLNGASLKTVADCMGQRSTVQTLKYLNYVDALKSEAIAKLPSVNII